MRKTTKLSATALLMAIGTLTSHLFYIPLGFAKIFPLQHVINVLSAVLLGPFYAVLCAFGTSLLRNLFGTGSILAFPGSMIGAFLAAFLYQKTKNMALTALGEVVGTGIIGAMIAYPFALLFLGKNVALFAFVPSFIMSSFGGALLGYIFLRVLIKRNGIENLRRLNS
ncbi:energy coupling factor transporter S component ThiW [Priestia endophytica]|uniref:energy coupling factor transporter S component ThiW n=1 Tax=Priestia endophytica TaxID=135735 RepID=UPI000F54AC53|nr:energy coupling factor transporter S component ThiW [Priestia endophytica]MED4074344.1 energy coupling factor transporter S component ThiW [Priestia endophytica]RPK01888.1 hypothetical protein FH5_02309 [Priestia endophytica]